jgi:nucleotide-binding universal stress UspA family protein
MKFDNILVPYDGSDCSKRAFNSALDLARHANSRITILTCIEAGYNSDLGFDPEFTDSDELKAKERALDDMEELKERANKDGIQAIKKVVKTLSIPKTLVELSDSSDVDLVIMGSHGRTGLNKFVFGNITNKVAPISHCPIMIVK